MRKLLIGLLVLIVVLVGGLLAAPSLIDWNRYKDDVAAKVAAATGRALAIDGDLAVSLLPRPTLTVEGVRLANIDGAPEPDMVRLRAALVQVALGPLLRGRLEVDAVVLVEPRIELIRLLDGRTNWTLQPRAAEPRPPRDGGFISEALATVQLNDVRIRDGTVVLRDLVAGSIERADRINAAIVAGSLQGPFRAEGDMITKGVALRFAGALGRLVEDVAVPLNMELSAGGGMAAFAGILSGYPTATRVSGQLSAGTPNAGDSFLTMVGGRLPDILTGAMALDATLTATREAVALNDLSLRLGDVSATGSLDVLLAADRPQVDLVVNAGRFDLDRMLADLGSVDREGPDTGRADDTGESSQIVVVPGRRDRAAAGLPDNFDASLEVKVDAVVYSDGIIRQGRLTMELEDGTLTVSQASALLPGGSDITLFGVVEPAGDTLSFDGQVEANSDNFRGLLEWLNINVGDVPPDRLRKFELAAGLHGTPEELTISNIDMQVDVSRIRGGVAAALRERPGFGIGFSVDKVNVDAYLPRASAGSVAVGEAPAAPRRRLAALGLLNRFDAILQFQIGSLTLNEESVTGVAFDGTLQGGALELRQASIADVAGASFTAGGTITGLDGQPAVALDVTLEAGDTNRLFKLAGRPTTVPLGPGRFSSKLEGNLESLRIDAELGALGGSLRTTGTLSALATQPGYDIEIELDHPNAGQLVRALGGNAPAPAGGGQSPLRVAGRLAGDLAAADVDVRVGLGEGSIRIDGAVTEPIGDATAALTLVVEHPDLAAFVRTFRADYRPALADLGALQLTANASYSAAGVNLSDIDGRLGPVAVAGGVDVSFAGERPRVVANLATSEVIADWFLAPLAVAADGVATTGNGVGRDSGRWSRQPIDFSMLRRFDAELSLTAPGLGYETYNVQEPQLELALDDGVLDLRRLSGRAFDGAFNMTARVADADVPTAQFQLAIDGADAAKITRATKAGRQQGDADVMSGVLGLLFPVSAVQLQSGRLGADLTFNTSGRNEFELVSNLAGQGAVRFTEAVVDGVDVCRLAQQIEGLNGIEGFLGLLASSRGGETMITDFAGRFDVERGVATLPPQQINAECAVAQIKGEIDLPRWLVDIDADVAFPQQPAFPHVVVEQKGSLDAPSTRLVNLNEIQQHLVGRAADTVIRSLLPSDIQQALPTLSAPAQQQPVQQPTQEAAEPSVNDAFKSLLETLIR